MYTHTYIYIYTYVYTYIYIYIPMYTHIFKQQETMLLPSSATMAVAVSVRIDCYCI